MHGARRPLCQISSEEEWNQKRDIHPELLPKLLAMELAVRMNRFEREGRAFHVPNRSEFPFVDIQEVWRRAC